MELARLRNATEAQHRKVEKDLDLLRPSFTRSHYVALLRQFYGFHFPWEPALEALLESELPGFFAPRRKLRNIESDLRNLGYKTEDLGQICLCEKLPTLISTGSALGSLYVIEGSSLGGRILTQHFTRHLEIKADAGCRFFSGYGDLTAQMWSAFRELVASRPSVEDDDMLKAAISTFEFLGGWLGESAYV